MNNHDNINYASQFYVFVVCFIRSKEKIIATMSTLHFFSFREEGVNTKRIKLEFQNCFLGKKVSFLWVLRWENLLLTHSVDLLGRICRQICF
jgi:hypothetical protein